MPYALRPDTSPVHPPADGHKQALGTRSMKALNGTGHAVRSRHRLTAQNLSAVLFMLAGITILMAIITGEALSPASYTTSHNTISDLGSTWQPGNIVREPSATIFNTRLLVAGLMIAAGATAFWRAYRSKPVAIALLLLGAGLVGVGVFPSTEIGGHASTTGIHPLASMLTFTAGGLAAVLAYRVTTPPFRYLSAALGLMALLSFVLSSPLGNTRLGLGGVERWVAYPVVLWIVAFGGYLLGQASETHEQPSRATPATTKAGRRSH